MFLLLPNASCKFLAHWQAPCTILERVGPVNYHLHQLGKSTDSQLYHINLVKRWVQPDPLFSTLSAIPSGSDMHTLVLQGEDLIPTQHQELTELVDQFTNIFSSSPDRTDRV